MKENKDTPYIKFLQWVYEWAKIYDGICGVITFRLYRPGKQLKIARKISSKRLDILLERVGKI